MLVVLHVHYRDLNLVEVSIIIVYVRWDIWIVSDRFSGRTGTFLECVSTEFGYVILACAPRLEHPRG